MSAIFDDTKETSQVCVEDNLEPTAMETDNLNEEKETAIEPIETDQIISEKTEALFSERRLSQFSETDTNEQEIKTPVQTDNDEVNVNFSMMLM